MHRSSETIGAVAAALAKAQSQLTNPEKSLTATIQAPSPKGESVTFRYASLSCGLDIIRTALGQHELAIVQTTSIDHQVALIRLTTVLAHSSGEWIASDWPVCALAEGSSPRRMGAALTYARRYALFTLVGIAGEDDLDAPDLDRESAQEQHCPPAKPSPAKWINTPRTHVEESASAEIRDRLLGELGRAGDDMALALWAKTNLACRNALTSSDARVIEAKFVEASAKFGGLMGQEPPDKNNPATVSMSEHGIPAALRRPVRKRNKGHLIYVASQPCLVCQKSPSDAHHLKFAQPRALGRKVSDEFTVPLCRDHHHQLHHHGNETAWWANVGLAPLEVAADLWASTLGGAQQDETRRGHSITLSPPANS